MKQVDFSNKLGKVEIVALFLGALEKGYHISDISYKDMETRSATLETFSTYGYSETFRLHTQFDNGDYITINTHVTNQNRHRSNPKQYVRLKIFTTPIITSPGDLNKYIDDEVYFGSYQDMDYSVHIPIAINGEAVNGNYLFDFGTSKHDNINSFDFVVKNEDLVKQIVAISWFNIDPMALPEPEANLDEPRVHMLNIRSFAKLRKYANIIKNRKKPSEEAMERTLRLLQDAYNIMRSGDTVVSSTFRISKIEDAIVVKVGGIDIIYEYALAKYKYLQHPGINLMAAMLEYGKAFLNLENQFNKSLLKRI